MGACQVGGEGGGGGRSGEVGGRGASDKKKKSVEIIVEKLTHFPGRYF